MASFESDGLPVHPFEQWFEIWLQGADDWAAGELSNTKLPMSFSRVDHFPYACAVCRRSEMCGNSLSRCAKCKRVWYCCREHQTRFHIFYIINASFSVYI
jgi:hypothetical protein